MSAILPKRSRKPKSRPKSNRPSPPRKDFPLYAHPCGRWCCKSQGRFYYFGRWGQRVNGKMVRLPDDGAEQALVEYLANYEAVLAGRPLDASDTSGEKGSLTLRDLCNRFLNDKSALVQNGELSPRTLIEYRQTTDRLIATFGKEQLVDRLKPSDFAKLRAKIAETAGPVRLGNEITRVKSVFKHGKDNGWTKEMQYGTSFSKPSKKVLRLAKAERGKKLFEADEIHLLLKLLDGKEVTTKRISKVTGQAIQLKLKKPNPQLRAMVLLGLNCGFGNTDISGLQTKHLNLDGGWFENFPRQKTGSLRRGPLWPETVQSIRAALKARPTATDPADSDCVFLTSQGTRMMRVTIKSRTDYIGRTFGGLLKKLGINGREGLNFYSLRHTFATHGLQAKDRSAVKAIMGHEEGDILSAYDETGPCDERLLAVVNCVRTWLFGRKS